MELRDTEEEAAFRQEVREFIVQNLPSSAKTRELCPTSLPIFS